MGPLFSVVIPTRNRARTLERSLKTALFQDFDDYEVVVSDNCSADETAGVVAGAASRRIRYTRPPAPLAMTKNWEHGIGQARGRYVVVLSDDDGLLRNTLSQLSAVIRATGARVVKWHRAQYNWPRYPIGDLQNLLIYTRPRYRARFVGSAELLWNALRWVDSNDTPGLVNCAVGADVLEALRRKTGRIILSYSPDTASGIAIPCVVDRVYLHDEVLSIAGVSEFSNGTMLVRKDNTEVVKEFLRLNREVGEYGDRFFEALGGSNSAIVLDSIHDVARYFPDAVHLDRVDMVRAYAQSIDEFSLVNDPALRERLVQQVYREARWSHGASGVWRVRLLVTRGRVARAVNSPSLGWASVILRAALNKPYGRRHYFYGDTHGFKDIVSAAEFLDDLLRLRAVADA